MNRHIRGSQRWRWHALVLLGLALRAGSVPALPVTTVDLRASEVTFVSRQMGVPVQGRFKKFSAQLAFDAEKPAASRAQIEIDLDSLDTGSDEADAEVKSKGWFNTRQYPTARFVSSAVKALSAGRYQATGKLTIKGRTRDVTIPFTLRKDAAGAAFFEGAFSIRRLEFGIGEGAWSDTDTVADEVEVRFRIVGKPARR